jgi:protein involved in polysaccharide export with SLBB domain
MRYISIQNTIIVMFIIFLCCIKVNAQEDSLNPGKPILSQMDNVQLFQNQKTFRNNNSSTKSELNDSFNNQNNGQPSDDNKKSPALSKYEEMYYLNNDVLLKQYGYDLFTITGKSFAGVNDKLLAPGDQLQLNLWGDAIDILLSNQSGFQPSMNLTIDRDGFIYIPTMGTIFVTGLNVKEAENQITNLLNQKYFGINVDLKIGQASSIPVYVTGEAQNPGMVMVSQSASIIEALSAAGGVRKTGTLRNITISDKYKSRKITVDLYDFISNKSIPDWQFKKGDLIYIPGLKNVVALNGKITSPGIYEFKNKETLRDLLNFAGNVLPSASNKRIYVETYDKTLDTIKSEDIPYSRLTSFALNSGDLVTFVDTYPEKANVVFLEGNVKNTGFYELKEGMTLNDLLINEEILLPQTFAHVVEVTREDGLGRNPQVFNFDLRAIIENHENIPLQKNDKIRILKDTSLTQIKLSGALKEPALVNYHPGLTLLDAIGDVVLAYPHEKIVVEIVNKNDKETKIVYLYDLLTKNQQRYNYELNEGDEVFFRPMNKAEQYDTVTILGQVQNPGIYRLEPGLSLNELIIRSGGLDSDSYLNGIVLARKDIRQEQNEVLEQLSLSVEADLIENRAHLLSGDQKDQERIGEVIANQQKLLDNIKQRSERLYGRLILLTDYKEDIYSKLDINLKEGDIVYIPDKPDHILIAGEVFNQAAIVYDPEKKVKEYINDVGGFTKKAAKKKSYIVKSNGLVVSYLQSRSKFMNSKLDPGDSIIIPAKTGLPLNVLELITNIADIFAKVGTSAYIITKI